jgi:hypothetical protein
MPNFLLAVIATGITVLILSLGFLVLHTPV